MFNRVDTRRRATLSPAIAIRHRIVDRARHILQQIGPPVLDVAGCRRDNAGYNR
jgi:hypothetical protein